MENESPFGPVIYAYTRAQALEDGVLVDVSEMARDAGFKHPVAITERLHSTLEHVTVPSQDYKGRLWDVLNMLMDAIVRSGGGKDRVYFKVKVGREVVDLWAMCGPGDDAKPVITVMFTDED